jgi:hypothetical protein
MDRVGFRADVTIIQLFWLGDDPSLDYPAFVKPIDETRTNTTTLTADTHLQFDTEPNTIYFIRGAFIAYAALTPDMKWTLGHTGTTDAAMFGARRAGTMADPSALMLGGNQDFWMISASMMASETPVDVPVGSANTGTRVVAYFEGLLSVGASGGVFSLKWAQNTLSGDPTTVQSGSWLHRQIVSSEAHIKAATTSRTSTTTATADPDLQAVLATDTDYVMHMGVLGRAGTTPDFKIGLDDGGGTPTYFGGFVNLSENAYTLATITDANEQIVKTIGTLTTSLTQPMTGLDTAGTGNFYDLECAGRFSVAANPFALIWAQNNLSGTATSILEDSYLLARPVSAPDQIVWKTGDETRTSSPVLANDAELSVDLEADTDYIVSIVGLFSSAATPDIQFALSFDGTCTDFTGTVDSITAGTVGNAINGAADVWSYTGSSAAFGSVFIAGSATSTDMGGIRYAGLLRVGGSGGTLRLTWAQFTSDAGDTTVRAGSYIHVEPKS